jgi:transcriptional regulator with XRE-family HTH domain
MDNERRQQPLASQVAKNVRLIRQARGLHLADVAERMTQYGQPLSLSGVSKVEQGRRGVNLDELAALARALDVTPLLLVLPIGHEATVELFPDAPPVSTWEAANWFGGGAVPAHLKPGPAPHLKPAPGPFAPLGPGPWPDSAVPLFRHHDRMRDNLLAADLDVQQASNQDTYALAVERRRLQAADLSMTRADIRRLGLEPPALDDPLRAFVGEVDEAAGETP